MPYGEVTQSGNVLVPQLFVMHFLAISIVGLRGSDSYIIPRAHSEKLSITGAKCCW